LRNGLIIDLKNYGWGSVARRVAKLFERGLE